MLAGFATVVKYCFLGIRELAESQQDTHKKSLLADFTSQGIRVESSRGLPVPG